MALSCAHKLVLVLLAIAYVFATSAEANRGWGWGSNQTGSGWGRGWGSNQTGGWGWGFNQTRSGWGWGWGSNQTGSWGWGWGRNGGGAGGRGSNNQTGSWGWGWGSNGGGSSGPNNQTGGWGWGWDHSGSGNGGSDNQTGWWGRHNWPNATQGPRKVVVGGSAGWQYGFNYPDWAFKNAPFYVNDVLVFKYDPPAPFTHSVYLLPDKWSYLRCDLKRAKMIGSTSQGAGNGFEFVLRKRQPYYFACGEHDGVHCNNGTMKFFVTPMLGRWY